jgi:hypothetical protein
MTSINGYTLFPHPANWDVNPSWSRQWKTGVATGTTGAEQRSALRALPLHTLTYSITATTLPERSRLDARIDQATKSGFGCVPFFGRGICLSADAAAGTNTITLTDFNAWPWAAGDYIILLSDDLTFDAWLVNGVGGTTLTLAGNLVNSWSAQERVWPLLFGKFSSEAAGLLTMDKEKMKISVAQLVSERNAQLGATPAHVPGVGEQSIGSTNTIG